MKKKTILLIFFSIVLIGAIIWCVNTPYREVNLNNTLETIQKNDTCITVHDLYKDKDWDKMVIIKPYDKRTASDEKIDMGYTGDREAILDNTLFDSICTILFLKGNQLVAFSSVYRNVIDFSPLNKKTYKSSDKICIINKVATDC